MYSGTFQFFLRDPIFSIFFSDDPGFFNSFTGIFKMQSTVLQLFGIAYPLILIIQPLIVKYFFFDAILFALVFRLHNCWSTWSRLASQTKSERERVFDTLHWHRVKKWGELVKSGNLLTWNVFIILRKSFILYRVSKKSLILCESGVRVLWLLQASFYH